jgi:glutamate/aspartate transport system permease protein
MPARCRWTTVSDRDVELSLTDLVGAASNVAQLNGRLVEMYLTVAVIYLAICSAASQCVVEIRKRNELPSGAR